MLESMSAGLNAGLRENKGSDTLQTLASYKTRQDALREQARQFNETYALEAQKVASDTRYRDAQTDTLNAQLEAYQTQLRTMQQQAFRNDVSNQFVGAAKMGEWSGVMNTLRNNELGAPIAEQLQSLQSVNNVSDEALAKIVSPEELKLIRNNPKGFVIVGAPDNYKVIDVATLGAVMGITNQLNAQQIQQLRDDTAINALTKFQHGTAGVEDVSAALAMQDPTKGAENAAKIYADTLKNKANGVLSIPNPKTEFGVQYNKFVNLLGTAKNEQTRQAVLAEFKTMFINYYNQLSQANGSPLTAAEFYEQLPDEGKQFLNVIKDSDKAFQDLKKQGATQSGILAQQLMNSLETNVETFRDLKMFEDKNPDEISSWLSRNAPFASSTWLSMQNLLGDNSLMSYEALQHGAKNRSADLNFMVTFTKYISGVAFREQEQDNIKDIYSKFGDSFAKRTALIIQNLEQKKHELQKKRNQDTANFTLYQSDDLLTIEALLGIVKEMNAAASKGKAPNKEQQDKIQKYSDLLNRIRGKDILNRFDANQAQNIQPANPNQQNANTDDNDIWANMEQQPMGKDSTPDATNTDTKTLDPKQQELLDQILKRK